MTLPTASELKTMADDYHSEPEKLAREQLQYDQALHIIEVRVVKAAKLGGYSATDVLRVESGGCWWSDITVSGFKRLRAHLEGLGYRVSRGWDGSVTLTWGKSRR